MSNKVATAVRAEYERRPYPPLTKARSRRPKWLLPPWEWISALAQTTDTPRRILVAGCGTGEEAFALHRRFPRAEIVGIDFAARSIRLAQRVQEKEKRSHALRFLRADLTSDRLPRLTGGNFDFISCHGVPSYLPAPERALRNFARCLAPRGLLYLGVNGDGHFAERWRPALSGFGFAVESWPGAGKVWPQLELVAALAGDTGGKILRYGTGYLASDLFGALIRNLPLAAWVRQCNAAGLHLRGSYGLGRLLWPAINRGSYELLRPRSRGQVSLLLDTLSANSFHRLVFTREEEAQPPWENTRALLHWRPLRTEHFRGFKWPARPGARLLKLQNPRANIALELRGAGWEIDLLRASDGAQPLREILAPLRPRVAPKDVRSQLYLFYLLDLINLLPPS